MRALITGIDGFVGQYLQRELESNAIECFGTSLGKSRNNIFHLELEDLQTLVNILQDIRPDFLFHLAGCTSVLDSWKQPELFMKVNRDGTENIYKALGIAQVSPKVLLTSSAEVYGLSETLPITEEHPAAPRNPYAESKLAQESVARNFPNVHSIIVRSFPHIGPGQSPTFVTSNFARQIARVERGEQSALQVGNLEAIRDFTDVQDVVRAYRLLIETGRPNEIYNVASGHGYSIQSILDGLLSYSTLTSIQIETDPDKMRPSEIPSLIGDHTKLSKETGWQPKINITSTLQHILTYWRTAS